MEKLLIRNETVNDFVEVENLIRESFWNVYVPGCEEHYLAHVIRSHEDFIPELDFVLELDGKIIGNVMYTKSWLVEENGERKEILTFGPICIHPDYQRRGCSRMLLEHSFEKAAELGYDVIVIFGNPENYVSRGFKSCKRFNVSAGNDVYPCAMLVKELKQGALDGRSYVYQDSPAFQIDSKKAQEFDSLFETKEKKELPSQEAFYIYSHSVVQ